jgi:hypothetical protein
MSAAFASLPEKTRAPPVRVSGPLVSRVSRLSEAPDYAPPPSWTAGATIVWLLRGADAPAADGWTGAVQCTGAGGVVIDATVATEGGGPDYRVTVSAAQTTTLGAGSVGWSATASKDTEVVPLGHGRFLLSALSGLSADETRLAELDAAIHALTLGGVQSYQVAGRTFSHYELTELRKQRNVVAGRVRRARTGSPFVNYLVRF